MHFQVPIVGLAALAIAGCTTVRSTDPQRTATEQLLISTAADKAAESLSLDIPKDKLAFIDAQNFDGYDSKYAIGAIRDHFLQQGLHLTNDKSKADTIIEIRSGVLSIDERATLVGVPQIDIPFPLAGNFSVPEIALYKRETQQGVAKFAATSYDAKEGTLIASTHPHPSSSYQKKTTLLFLISWTNDDLGRPKD